MSFWQINSNDPPNGATHGRNSLGLQLYFPIKDQIPFYESYYFQSLSNDTKQQKHIVRNELGTDFTEVRVKT